MNAFFTKISWLFCYPHYFGEVCTTFVSFDVWCPLKYRKLRKGQALVHAMEILKEMWAEDVSNNCT